MQGPQRKSMNVQTILGATDCDSVECLERWWVLWFALAASGSAVRISEVG